MFEQAFKNIDDVLWKEAWIKRRIGWPHRTPAPSSFYHRIFWKGYSEKL